MNVTVVIACLALAFVTPGNNRVETLPPAQKIVLAMKVPASIKSRSITLLFAPARYISSRIDFQTTTADVTNGHAKWSLPASEPLIIRIPWQNKQFSFYYFEPGDSIEVATGATAPVFTGNAKVKFDLLQAIINIPSRLPSPANSQYFKTNSLDDYLEWNIYLNRQKTLLSGLLQDYHGKINQEAFEYIKRDALENIEKKRIMKFYDLYNHYIKKDIPPTALGIVYDTTIINPDTKWMNSLTENSGNNGYYYIFAALHLKRQQNFAPPGAWKNGAASLLSRAEQHLAHGEKLYSGEIWYNYQTQVITEDIVRKLLFEPGTQRVLDGYYAQSLPGRYKEYTKKFEQKIRRRMIGTGQQIGDYTYTTADNVSFGTKNKHGEIQIFTFLKEGDTASASMAHAIKELSGSLSGARQVVFKNILIPDSTGASGSQPTGNSFPSISILKMAQSSAILRDFLVEKFPAYYIIDPEGKFAATSLETGKGEDNGEFPDYVSHEIAKLVDGPYVYLGNDSLHVLSVQLNGAKKNRYPYMHPLTVAVQTDRHDRTFSTIIRKNALPPPAEYVHTGNIFSVSDIEGNFRQFRQLLQANGIIDDKYNWTFGNGHLVLLGDFFDRGKQVTECLWLIYMLEEKAKNAGGHVHFILGNHELMNFSGDLRYVQQKYTRNASALDYPYYRMYDQTSILGQWLRSKNIIEKIGDIVFVHGGISEEITRSGRSLADWNDLARSKFGLSAQEIKEDSLANFLLYSKHSPCWHRDYYDDHNKVPDSTLGKTLSFFDASRVITGHTVIGNIITVHYNGKVINIDTRHKYGFSEGLLIDHSGYYRTDTRGRKVSLNIPDITSSN